MYDAIVIGAGPAGLQAALTLGRMHRSTLLIDSGEYRNGTVAHMHNMIGADGASPAKLRATARTEISGYDDVEILSAFVEKITGAEDAFRVHLTEYAKARHNELGDRMLDQMARAYDLAVDDSDLCKFQSLMQAADVATRA